MKPAMAHPRRFVPRSVMAFGLSFGLLALLTTSPGGPGLRQAVAAAPTAAEKHAREMFQRAEMSFNLGKFSDALADYQAAYQAKPLPAFLFNIAQCYRNMQDYERARFFYRRYLALDPRTANRRLVEDLIGEMSKLVEKADAEKAVEAGKVADTLKRPDVPPPVVEPTGAATTPPTATGTTTTTASLTPASATATTTSSPAPVPPPVLDLPAAPEASVDVKTAPDGGAPEARPIYKRWWFWGGVAAVIAGGVAIAVVATRNDSPQGSLGTINGR